MAKSAWLFEVSEVIEIFIIIVNYRHSIFHAILSHMVDITSDMALQKPTWTMSPDGTVSLTSLTYWRGNIYYLGND